MEGKNQEEGEKGEEDWIPWQCNSEEPLGRKPHSDLIDQSPNVRMFLSDARS